MSSLSLLVEQLHSRDVVVVECLGFCGWGNFFPRQSSKDLSEPLLAHSESYIGRTWKRPKGIIKQREEEPEADLENQGWRKNRDSSDRENQSSLVTADVNVCS